MKEKSTAQGKGGKKGIEKHKTVFPIMTGTFWRRNAQNYIITRYLVIYDKSHGWQKMLDIIQLILQKVFGTS